MDQLEGADQNQIITACMADIPRTSD